MKTALWAILLVGCGGAQFEFDAVGTDAGAAGEVVATGGASGGESSGGALSAGGVAPSAGGSEGDSGGTTGGTSSGTGGTMSGDAGTGGGPSEEAGVPQPPCCVDADCPASIPFCSPWGTCYQGGDPYNCDYDALCESFCVHCSGSAAGACEEKRCVCS